MNNRKKALLLAVLLTCSLHLVLPLQAFCQKQAEPKLEKWPADLERDFALSSLPPHLRKDATVYLLNPAKGFYVDKKGTNGFVCFVSRTEWEWGKFRNDFGAAMAYDAAGATSIVRVYMDVAAMRASGKYTAAQVKNIVTDRIKKGIYKAPARPGISYMLAPVMRAYPGGAADDRVLTMGMPHYMFYAPYMNNADIGGSQQEAPFLVNPGSDVLGNKKGPFGYIIVPVGEKEAAKIVKDNSALLKRLAAYRAYFKVNTSM